MKIDRIKHRIGKKNFHKKKTSKSKIMISFSLRKGNNHIIRMENREFGNCREWNTYTISREGDIYEHYDPKYYSEFIGVELIDKQSISIVLENMGNLILHKKKFINWLNEECDMLRVYKKKWLGGVYWESFTNEQIKSLLELIDYLCKEFKIPNKLIEFDHYNKDAFKFDGILYKNNFVKMSGLNINPHFYSFNLKETIDGKQDETNS